MSWVESALGTLMQQPLCGYAPGHTPATEPTALASLALSGAGRFEAARRGAAWLAECQAGDGSVGVRQDAATPRWPTALAMLAWTAAGPQDRFETPIEQALEWTLSRYGERGKPSDITGHDPTLAAWPWVEGTHSWVEPSALHVIALKAAGFSLHERTREAVRLLIDRQLPDGGCNYGNTIVLGQLLRPHVQPTGLAMLALAGEVDPSGRIERSLEYLERHLSAKTSSASLGWGLLGLTAHDRRPPRADAWLAAAAERRGSRRPFGHKLALLVLASQGSRCPLVAMPTAPAAEMLR